METETKNTWGGKRANTGGKREGAGRKPTGLPTVKQRAVAFTDEAWQEIKRLAEENNLSVNKFLLLCVENFKSNY